MKRPKWVFYTAWQVTALWCGSSRSRRSQHVSALMLATAALERAAATADTLPETHELYGRARKLMQRWNPSVSTAPTTLAQAQAYRHALVLDLAEAEQQCWKLERMDVPAAMAITFTGET